jgi:hypothetical protein
VKLTASIFCLRHDKGVAKLNSRGLLPNDEAIKKIRFAAMGSSLQLAEAKTLGKRFHVPKVYQDLLELVIKTKKIYQKIKLENLLASPLLQLYEVSDAFRRKERFLELLIVAEAKDKNASPLKNQVIFEIYQKVAKISVAKLIATKHLDEQNIREEIHRVRLEKIKKLILQIK